MSEYPEHDRLTQVAEASQIIGEYLEDRDARGIVLCRLDDYTFDYRPISRTITEELANYFNIDLGKIEAEKRAMLARLREQQDT